MIEVSVPRHLTPTLFVPATGVQPLLTYDSRGLTPLARKQTNYASAGQR